MSELTNIEKMKLEKLFSMSGGYVLDFSNSSFQRFILDSVGIDIYDKKYEAYGASKANHLRVLWKIEIDKKVGKLIEDMLLYWETKKDISEREISKKDEKLFQECMDIAFKLQGKEQKTISREKTIEDFLKNEVDEIPVNKIKIDGAVIDVLEQRIIEVKQCLNAGASLSVIFLCGSILEGLLLGIASINNKEFNQSQSSPKDKTTNKVKPFHEWTLSNFIDVAHDIGMLGLDVRKYSHSLRDFRNYIHPFQQMSSGFKPDMHTARISWQVLKAALHDLHKNAK